MKRGVVLLVCVAMLISLAGCLWQAEQPLQPAPPFDEPEAEFPAEKPEDVVPPPQEEDETQVPPVVPEDPLRPEMLLYLPQQLSFEDDTYLQPGPEGTVLVISQRVIDQQSLPYRIALRVMVYDPQKDEILAQADLKEGQYILPQVFADKTFCVASSDGARYEFFDKQLQYVHAYRRPVDAPGYFSHDKRFYYYADGNLKRHVMESGDEEVLPVAGGLPVRTVMAIHPTADLLCLSVETDPFGLSGATALYDAVSAQLEWFQADYVSMTFCEQSTIFYLFEDDRYRCIYDAREETEVYEVDLQMNDLQSFSMVSNGPYLLAKMAGQMRLYCFSQTPEYADLSQFPSLHDPISMLYDAGTNSLIFSLRAAEKEPCRIAMLDLDLLPFMPEEQVQVLPQEAFIDTARIEHYFEIEEPVQLRGGLDYLRDYADELEECFGVQILFSGECAEPCAYSDFAVQTTDSLSLRYESQLVYNALMKMEETLSSYPEGFFAQFQSENISGIRFLLVSTIESSYGVVAYEYFRDGWFNIVYDVNYQSTVTANLNHELWHATEEKLNYIDGVWVDEALWSSFNPEGFSYSEDYETHYDNSSEFVYYTEHEPERVFFIDTYSKTFAKEDRARIMEYAMSYEYFMERLQYSEAIMQKLSCMAQLLREHFDTSGWPETALWEAFLPQEAED